MPFKPFIAILRAFRTLSASSPLCNVRCAQDVFLGVACSDWCRIVVQDLKMSKVDTLFYCPMIVELVVSQLESQRFSGWN